MFIFLARVCIVIAVIICEYHVCKWLRYITDWEWLPLIFMLLAIDLLFLAAFTDCS